MVTPPGKVRTAGQGILKGRWRLDTHRGPVLGLSAPEARGFRKNVVSRFSVEGAPRPFFETAYHRTPMGRSWAILTTLIPVWMCLGEIFVFHG